jgi:Predicted oxidoreductases (related to aryl-alcohol dehydrogenases)
MAEFVLGCVQIGLAYGIANRAGKPTRAQGLELLGRARAAGIRIFDTASAYGDAEERLGEAFGADPVTIVTKLSPLSELTAGDPPERAVAAAEASVARSCEALRRNRLDCLLLHRASHRTGFGGAIWQRLLAYQQAGIVRRLGVSVQSAAEAEAAMDDLGVGHIQLPFNLLDRRWDQILSGLAARPGMTVHVRSIFLQGLLAAGDPAIWPAVPGVDAAAVVAAINGLVRDLGRESPADLCLAYVRGHAVIAGAVIGLETIAQLEANLHLFAKPALTPSEIAAVRAALPPMPEQLLNPALWPKS